MGWRHGFALSAVVMLAVTGVAFGRSPPNAPDESSPYSLEDFADLTRCSAVATASVTLTSKGSASASASSTCHAKAEAVRAIESAMREWLDAADATPKSACRKGKMMRLAREVSAAAAQTYALARIDVAVDGRGTACASAEAEADAYAAVFAKAILHEPIQRGFISAKDDGMCLAGALSAVFARAWAEAKVAACQEGTGEFEDYEVSFAESVEAAVARVVAEIAKVTCTRPRGVKRIEKLMGYINGGSEAVDAEASAETLQRVAEGVAAASGGSLAMCSGKGAGECCGAAPTEQCKWSAKAGLMWENGRGRSCCCLEGLLPYLDLDVE
eukprot:evm.model.scf_188.13 EVM.evm.TU.scf_188.13   scf_188:123130-124113(+)